MKNYKWPLPLAVVLIASVLLRAAAALYLGDQVVVLPGTSDQVSYHNLAIRVLEGHGFTFGENWWPLTRAGEPTAHWSYLYTGYLALVYKLVGVNPLAPRLIQAALVGFFHPLLAYLLARRMFDQGVGIGAAVLTAGYAYFVYYAATLMTEPFFILGIMVSLYLAVRLADQAEKAVGPSYATAAALGLALGATVLLRQLFLLMIPFLLLWVAWRRGPKIKPLALSALIVAAVIVPFTMYNLARFDQFVLLNTNSGFAFFWANHPIYGTRFVSILPPEMGTYANLIPSELRDLNEAALDRALLERGLGFVSEDPLRYLMLSVSRVPEYFKFWPSPASGRLSNLARVASFGILWPFMLAGVVLAIRRGLEFRSPETLMLVIVGAYSAIHILSWALIRYRLPVDAVILLFAPLAVLQLWRWAAHVRHPSQVPAYDQP